MATLVHIAAENAANRIRRNGIAPSPRAPDPDSHPCYDRAVWSFPVLESYTLTHSWSRELKRWGRSTLVAVTFVIDDAEPVFVSHYNGERLLVSASEAVGIVRRQPDPRGFEIMVPRRIMPAEVRRIAVLPRAIGWRYWPGARGAPMRLCDCPMCKPRGEVKAAHYRRAVAARMTD